MKRRSIYRSDFNFGEESYTETCVLRCLLMNRVRAGFVPVLQQKGTKSNQDRLI